MKVLYGRLVVVMIGMALMTSGCVMAITGSAKVEKEAFTPKKKYALVSVAAVKEFSGEKGMSQMFTSMEDIEGTDTQPIIDALVPTIRARFAKTGYFTSIPMKQIVNSKAYKAVEEDEKTLKVAFFTSEINPATGYKYISDTEKLAKLARDLNVDGVITVMMSFSIASMKSGVGIAGLTFGKKEYASNATITAMAYDRNGEVIYKDTTVKEADPDDKKSIVVFDTSDWSATHFKEMHPSAVRVGAYSVDVLLERFADTMEGRGTSSFQRVRSKESREATKAPAG